MTSPFIAVDVGNTVVSAAKFSPPFPAPNRRALPEPQDVWQSTVSDLDLKTLEGWASDARWQWIVGSVNDDVAEGLRTAVQRTGGGDAVRILTHADFPLRVDVEAPQRVGIDRLAAASAANALRDPSRPAIVIDTGTAVTVDVISADGTFRGGLIFPGMQLSLRALAQGTFQLPLLAPIDAVIPSIGKNTDDAMQAGVFWTTLGAVHEIVHRLQADELKVDCDIVVTGGDMRRLLPHLKFSVRHEPHLVLAGIAITQC